MRTQTPVSVPLDSDDHLTGRRQDRRAQPVTIRSVRPTNRRWRIEIILAAGLLACIGTSGYGQISLTTAVDLALKTNPKVLAAQDDIKKARAQLSEVYDAWVPTITAGGGIGQAYGYSPSPPTLGTVSGGSLVFNASQADYIRSAHSGLTAAHLALDDAKEAVAEDTALAFLALDHDQQREQAIRQETGFAARLVEIVQQRLDAGQDSPIDLTDAKLAAAQLQVISLKAQDDTAYDREHLARIISLPSASLSIDGSFPTSPVPEALDSGNSSGKGAGKGYANPGVASAFASAEARRQQAAGQARFRLWPEINLVAQYNRYATFTDSFAQLQKIYTVTSKQGVAQTLLTANEGAFGIQITLPILDRGRAAKAREATAEALRAKHDAQTAQIDALDGQSRLRHGLSQLQAQSDVAALQQLRAQQQLDIVRLQLNSGTGNPDQPQLSPKDEQKARIAERDKYLAVLDASFQLRQAEIQLLRQMGQLVSWLKSSLTAMPTGTLPTPQP